MPQTTAASSNGDGGDSGSGADGTGHSLPSGGMLWSSFCSSDSCWQTARHAHIGDRTLQERLLEDVLPGGEASVHLVYTVVLLLIVVAVVGLLHHRRMYLAL